MPIAGVRSGQDDARSARRLEHGVDAKLGVAREVLTGMDLLPLLSKRDEAVVEPIDALDLRRGKIRTARELALFDGVDDEVVRRETDPWLRELLTDLRIAGRRLRESLARLAIEHVVRARL